MDDSYPTTELFPPSQPPSSLVKKALKLSQQDRQKVLHDWNATQRDYPGDKSICELFELEVQHHPDRIALICAEHALTYAEIHHRTNQVAKYLLMAGLKPETPVGIFLPRSLEALISILGILKAGGVYGPLHLHYPAQVLSVILDDMRPMIIITREVFLKDLPAYPQTSVLCWETLEPALTSQDDMPSFSQIDGDNLAYIMYTSGSTGIAKGVCVTHRNVIRLVRATNYVCMTGEEIFLQLAPLSFDASTFEIWGALLNGGRLVLFPTDIPSVEALAQVLQEQVITILWLTAGLFHLVVETSPQCLSSVRQLLAGGDVLSTHSVHKLLQDTQFQESRMCVINGYGPTECTTFSTCYRMESSEQVGTNVSIGRPIANTQAYILDEHLYPVSIGAVGELYIGGDGLARGYLNRPSLTAERFLPHPFSAVQGARLYKTGDLARYRSDGLIEFCGRIDRQVKIRGFRVEPEAIEAVLRKHSLLVSAVVVVFHDPEEEKYLVAYLFSQAGVDTDALLAEVRTYLSECLPPFMIPSVCTVVDTWPLTANGKIDISALPTPQEIRGKRLSAHYVTARDALEATLVSIWEEVLAIRPIGIYDNFLSLGGHSLQATKICTRIRAHFQIVFGLHDLLENPIIASLALVVRARIKHSSVFETSIKPRPRSLGPSS